MMGTGDESQFGEGTDVREYLACEPGMLLHNFPLLGVETAFLVEDGVGDAKLAKVVEQRCAMHEASALLAQSHFSGSRDGSTRNSELRNYSLSGNGRPPSRHYSLHPVFDPKATRALCCITAQAASLGLYGIAMALFIAMRMLSQVEADGSRRMPLPEQAQNAACEWRGQAKICLTAIYPRQMMNFLIRDIAFPCSFPVEALCPTPCESEVPA